MQIKAAVAIGAVLSSSAGARSVDVVGHSQVVVCMERFGDPGLVISQARAITSRMFDRIGVAVAWRDLASCPGETQPIVINLLFETPRELPPKAFAISQPFEGVHIRVFYERLLRVGGHCPLPLLLAHVLAHEIGHMLQGTDHHAASGVMKSPWDESDFAQITRRPLSFSDLDILLIHRGLNARADRLRGSGWNGALGWVPFHGW